MVLADGAVVQRQIAPACWQGMVRFMCLQALPHSCGLSALEVSCVPVSLLDSLAFIPLIRVNDT